MKYWILGGFVALLLLGTSLIAGAVVLLWPSAETRSTLMTQVGSVAEEAVPQVKGLLSEGSSIGGSLIQGYWDEFGKWMEQNLPPEVLNAIEAKIKKEETSTHEKQSI